MQKVVRVDTNQGRAGRLIKTFEIYPNPAHYSVTVNVEMNEYHDAVVVLYSFQSNQKVMTTWLKDGNNYVEDLRLDFMPPGLYIIVLKAGGETKSLRMIKL
jgi:hypothetical protein